MVIGHELTHGFLTIRAASSIRKAICATGGRRRMARNLRNAPGCIADEYSNFVAVDDLKLNGRLTLGENTADNGGARIALMALEQMMAGSPAGPAAPTGDGYTPQQRFFLGFGRAWCEKRRPEYSRMLVSVDPHSPGKYRVNGVVQNMPEFQKAFNCKAGQPMVRENACRVW